MLGTSLASRVPTGTWVLTHHRRPDQHLAGARPPDPAGRIADLTLLWYSATAYYALLSVRRERSGRAPSELGHASQIGRLHPVGRDVEELAGNETAPA